MDAKAEVYELMVTSAMYCTSLHTGLIRAVGITPANVPEASVTEAISEDLKQQEACLKELHIDRAYLSSQLVRERSDELEVYCKAWPVHEGKRFSKQAFTRDLGTAGHSLPSGTRNALCTRWDRSFSHRYLRPVSFENPMYGQRERTEYQYSPRRAPC